MKKQTPVETIGQPQRIQVSAISKNPLNPRIFFREEEMDALRDSISRLGILVPLVAYPDSAKMGQFILIDGERRLRCARELGFKDVPVHVTAIPSERDNMLRMFNIHSLREQWDPYTIAMALKRLMELLGTSNSSELAVLTGFTRGSVERSKKLLRLPDQFLDLLKDELGKPKKDQVLTEDFFLEAYDATAAIKRFHTELYDQYGQTGIIGKLVERRKSNQLKSIVDLRMIDDIANYKRSRTNKSASSKLVKRIIEDPQYDIRAAYDEVVRPSVAAKSLLPQLRKVATELEELELNALTETSIGELAEALVSVKVAVDSTLKAINER